MSARSGKLISKLDFLIEELIKDSDYDFKTNGEVWSKKYNRCYGNNWRKLSLHRKGHYFCLQPKKNGPKILVHRIIYRKHLGPLSPDLMINHKDGNGLNNDISNLELVTASDNNKHRFQELKHLPVAGFRKINFEIAEEIRQMSKAGLSYNKILKIVGPKYNVKSKSTISFIVNNKTWNKATTLGSTVAKKQYREK